ncbi:hypothetical protein, partial [Klebsiella pneumoniae]|uniref:hypothetical protein n=1 Tax=Klebsiella pneumoniae TaxID=573 RepID=UPI000B223B63
EGELMAHDVPLGCAPDEYDDLISGTCSHLPLSSLASRVVREAENLYIPGVNRRDSADDVFAWSVQTQFPSDRLFGTRIFPSTGWFERPDMIKHPVKCYCVCLQYTTETLPSTLYALVDEAGRQVAKSYIKGGHCPGSEGYTFCITS